MTVPSLKQLALRRIGHPAFYRKLKCIGDCPYDLIEPVLKQMTHHQLLVLEANTPRLADWTLPLWKMHTLKVFPTVVDTHDVDSADAQDADWRLLFHELQDERQEREAAARDKLKANYSQIASGKSDRKIQVIKKSAPSKHQIRASAHKTSPLSLAGRNASTILGKAFRASMASPLRTSVRPAAPALQNLRPSPNSRSSINVTSGGAAGGNKKPLPSIDRTVQTSKFLTLQKKK